MLSAIHFYSLRLAPAPIIYMSNFTSRIPGLVEKACLNSLAIALRDAGHTELSQKIAKYIPAEEPDYLEQQLCSGPAGYDKGPILRLVLATVLRGHYQETGFNSVEDAHQYVRSKITLLKAAQSWVSAFSAGSPELAGECAKALGQPQEDGIYSLCLIPTDSDEVAYVYTLKDDTEIAVFTYLIFPDGKTYVPPIKNKPQPSI